MSSTAIYAVVRANAAKLRSVETGVFVKLDAIDALATVIESATNYPLAQKIAQRTLEEYARSREMIVNTRYNVVAQRVDQNGYVVNEKVLNSGEVFEMISFIKSLHQDDLPDDLWPKDGEFTDIMIFDHDQTVRVKRTLVGGRAAPWMTFSML